MLYNSKLAPRTTKTYLVRVYVNDVFTIRERVITCGDSTRERLEKIGLTYIQRFDKFQVVFKPVWTIRKENNKYVMVNKKRALTLFVEF